MRVTITQIKAMKQKGEKIAVLTAYDYATAKLIDEAGIPLILVGDSLGNVILGYSSTVPVTMEDMLHHAKAVVRGSAKALVIGDMPFMTYQISQEDALRNAARFMQEAGTQAVKLEGGEIMAATVQRIVSCGIPVMGHIGLTPQSVNQFGGFKVIGKTSDTAAQLLNDAIALEQAGAFAIVLELVPEQLSKLVSEKISIPTIGIGAGKCCDGQVQVISDMLGLYTDFVPKHVKQYAKLSDVIRKASADYMAEVQAGTFPTEKQSYTMDESILVNLKDSPRRCCDHDENPA